MPCLGPTRVCPVNSRGSRYSVHPMRHSRRKSSVQHRRTDIFYRGTLKYASLTAPGPTANNQSFFVAPPPLSLGPPSPLWLPALPPAAGSWSHVPESTDMVFPRGEGRRRAFLLVKSGMLGRSTELTALARIVHIAGFCFWDFSILTNRTISLDSRAPPSQKNREIATMFVYVWESVCQCSRRP